MKSYTDLEAWKVALDLVVEIYRITKKLPKEERYGLTSQLRRSSTSILANIAEGFGRFTYPIRPTSTRSFVASVQKQKHLSSWSLHCNSLPCKMQKKLCSLLSEKENYCQVLSQHAKTTFDSCYSDIPLLYLRAFTIII